MSTMPTFRVTSKIVAIQLLREHAVDGRIAGIVTSKKGDERRGNDKIERAIFDTSRATEVGWWVHPEGFDLMILIDSDIVRFKVPMPADSPRESEGLRPLFSREDWDRVMAPHVGPQGDRTT